MNNLSELAVRELERYLRVPQRLQVRKHQRTLHLQLLRYLTYSCSGIDAHSSTLIPCAM